MRRNSKRASISINGLMYLSKAREAFQVGDYKLCVVLLRRAPLQDPNVIQLYVDACYSAWKCGDSKFTLDEIQEAYSALFSSAEGSLIPSFEFVRLTHIYIKTGNLVGAMKTMQYAGFCGHLSNSLVVLQTWTLLRKLGPHSEAIKYMRHLCELITIELPVPDENGVMVVAGTDVPIYIVYMHCAHHIRGDTAHLKSKDAILKNKRRYEAMIIEAYTYHHRGHPLTDRMGFVWFLNYKTWMNIGRHLETTACILLAEEAYWVAYTCAPLQDEALHECLEVIIRHNRPQEKFSLLQRAYAFNHWNMSCRRQLLEMEQGEDYKKTFAAQNVFATTIQAAVRGFLTRYNWEATYDRVQWRREEYNKRLVRAQKMRTANLQRLMRHRVRRWRYNAVDHKALRASSALRLQMAWRCYYARKRRWTTYYRHRAANQKYLMACEIHHSMHLMQILKAWNRIWLQTSRDRCADLIVEFVKTSRCSAVLRWATKKLMALLKIRRKYEMPKWIRKYGCVAFLFCLISADRWRALYANKIQRRSRNTIRKFTRNRILAFKRQKLDDRLTTIVNNPSCEKIKANLLKIMVRQHWQAWREVLLGRLVERAKRLLAFRLPIIYARRKEKMRINFLRAKREFTVAGNIKHVYVLYDKFLLRWRFMHSVYRVQRRARMYIAYKRKARRIYQLGRVEYLYHRSWTRYLARLFSAWSIFLKRTGFKRQCAASKIRKWWIKQMRKLVLLRICRRKYGIGQFVELFHFKFLKKAFGQLDRMVFAQVKILALERFSRVCTKAYKKFSFPVLRRKAMQQSLVHGLVEAMIYKVIRRRVFCPVNTHNWNFSSPPGYVGGSISIMNWSTGRRVESTPGWPKLLNKAPSYVLHNFTSLKLNRAFQSWAALFRLRSMVRLNTAHAAVPTVLGNIVEFFQLKTAMAALIQRHVRGMLGRLRTACVRRERYIRDEVSDIVTGRTLYKLLYRSFFAGRDVVLRISTARLSIQCWFRVCLAWKKVVARKKIVETMRVWEKKVRAVHRRFVLSRIFRLMEFGCVLRCCEIKQSSPREMQIQTGAKQCGVEAIFRRVDRMKKGSTKDFVSEEYHNHVFRLRQTGILIVDCSNTTLRHNELTYLIQNARTIFSQSAGEHTSVIKEVTSYFTGDKIIFCGGSISDNGARELFYLLNTREEPLSLHFSEVIMPFKGVARISRAISMNFAKMKEFSVDSSSVGSLGIAALLVALKDSQSIESLVLKFNTGYSLLPCYAECFKCLVRNSYLKEIRIFGATLPAEIIEGINYAIQFGLSKLQTLEFDYDTIDKKVLIVLIETCNSRERTFTGPNISVKATEFSSNRIVDELLSTEL